MNEKLVQFLWIRLQPMFVLLTEYICNSENNFIHNIGKSSNSAFPLRAYLTFMKDNNSDEISVTVDVINRDGAYFIEADICGEDGLILADGPTIHMLEPTEKDLALWLEEYEAFLNSQQDMIKSNALLLK